MKPYPKMLTQNLFLYSDCSKHLGHHMQTRTYYKNLHMAHDHYSDHEPCAGFVRLHRAHGSCHWGQHSKTFVGIVLMRTGNLPHLLQPPGDHHPNGLGCQWITAQLSSLKKNMRMLWQSWSKHTGAIRRNGIMPRLNFWWSQRNLNGVNGFWRRDHLWQK